jgi:hypothetical protein
MQAEKISFSALEILSDDFIYPGERRVDDSGPTVQSFKLYIASMENMS